MRLHRKHSLLVLTFDNLEHFPELFHGVFTRRGGVSAGPFAGLNVGRAVGDEDAAVRQNRTEIARISGGKLVFLSQVHGTGIHVMEADVEFSDPPIADAAITNVPEQMATVQVADCQPVLLYDPEHRAVAAIHSGWRGSVANIIGACIAEMKDRFGTDPGRLVAGIGPSLGPCCAEFIHFQEEIPRHFWKYRDAADRFNFWRISHDQLTDAGVRPESIEWADICTKCNPHLFYSYRKSNTTGRFAAVIGLR